MPLLRSFLLLASLTTLPAVADEQAFYHITSQQCAVVDSLPVFTQELRPEQIADTYRIELLFPEYRALTSAERSLVPTLRRRLGAPTSPLIRQTRFTDRGKPVLAVSFCPFVCSACHPWANRRCGEMDHTIRIGSRKVGENPRKTGGNLPNHPNFSAKTGI